MAAAKDDRTDRQMRVRLGFVLVLVGLPVLLLIAAVRPISLDLATRIALLGGLVGLLWLSATHLRTLDCLHRSRAEGALHRARLEALLDSADAIFTFDGAGQVIEANEAASRLFGWPKEQLIGQTLGRLIVPRSGLQAPFVEGVRRDDTRFPAAIAVSEVQLADVTQCMAVVHDLSEMQRAREAAEAASRAKSSFLTHMSHEVRTPLNGILGMAQVLAASSLDEAQRRHLATLQESAESLLVLVRQVLDFSHLETGQVTLTTGTFSLRQLVREAIAPFVPLARSKGIRLSEQIDATVPDEVDGDSARLRQILVNLIGNAVGFTMHGAVTVRVQVSAQGSRSKQVSSPLLFLIEDTGIGIPPHQLQRIFEPFTQGDGSSTRAHGGLGLGLSIATHLAHLMGGDLTATSVPGQGSTFRLCLPLTVRRPSAQTTEDDSPVVLVALADERQRDRVQECMRAWGCRSLGVETGRAALAEWLGAMIRGKPFAVLLIEDSLPDLSAAQLLQQLGERCEQRCPTIVVADEPNSLPSGEELVTVLPHRALPMGLRDPLLLALSGAFPVPIL